MISRAMEDIVLCFEKRDLKMTPQRRKVVEVLLEIIDRRPTAEDVYLFVRGRDPEIGRATVYRTLDLLEELGIVAHVPQGDRRRHYQWCAEPQEQEMVCLRCRRRAFLDAPELADLAAWMDQRYGFRVQSQQGRFYGLCRHCLENTRGEEAHRPPLNAPEPVPAFGGPVLRRPLPGARWGRRR